MTDFDDVQIWTGSYAFVQAGMDEASAHITELLLQLRLNQNRDSLLVFEWREFDVGCGLVRISGGLAAGA